MTIDILKKRDYISTGYRRCLLRTLTVDIPDFIDIDEKELKLLVAAKLYEKGKLSLGQAGIFAGLSKRTFIELMGNQDVSVFNQEIEDLKNDIDNA